MDVWFLVMVLLLSDGVEEHVTIAMPDKDACETARSLFITAVRIDGESRTPIKMDKPECVVVTKLGDTLILPNKGESPWTVL